MVRFLPLSVWPFVFLLEWVFSNMSWDLKRLGSTGSSHVSSHSSRFDPSHTKLKRTNSLLQSLLSQCLLCSVLRAEMARFQWKGKRHTKVILGFCFQIYKGAKLHFAHSRVSFSSSFIAYIKENTLLLKQGNPPLKLWNTDTASSILAKVDWADDVDPLNLDSIKGFAIFISQARCSSSSTGMDSRRGVREAVGPRESLFQAPKRAMRKMNMISSIIPTMLVIQYSAQT